jgi:hypothetical protein
MSEKSQMPAMQSVQWPLAGTSRKTKSLARCVCVNGRHTLAFGHSLGGISSNACLQFLHLLLSRVTQRDVSNVAPNIVTVSENLKGHSTIEFRGWRHILCHWKVIRSSWSTCPWENGHMIFFTKMTLGYLSYIPIGAPLSIFPIRLYYIYRK